MSTPDESLARPASSTPPVFARSLCDHGFAAHHGLRCPNLRPGSIIKSLLTTMCGGALLLAAAAVLDPATLQANSSLPRAAGDSRAAERAALVRELDSLFAGAKAVLHVRPPRDDRGCEILLWLTDTRDPDHLNPEELALLRHSPLFQTLTFYTIAPGVPAAEHPATTLTPAEVASPGFIDRWRAETRVAARVLASGLSDFNAIGETQPPNVRASSAPDSPLSHLESGLPGGLGTALRIALQYSGDQVDDSAGPGDAFTVSARRHAQRSAWSFPPANDRSAFALQEHTP